MVSAGKVKVYFPELGIPASGWLDACNWKCRRGEGTYIG